MNRYSHLHHLGLLAALSLLAACSAKEQQMLPPSTEEVVLTAYMEGNGGTRTTLDKDYTTVLWMPEESISVFRGGKMAAFASDNTEE